MAALNISVEVPNMGMLNMDDLKRQLTNYARMLVKLSVDSKQVKHVRPLNELHPAIQQMCGVINVPEDDLDGEQARNEYLKEV